jgi:hypothetical protein
MPRWKNSLRKALPAARNRRKRTSYEDGHSGRRNRVLVIVFLQRALAINTAIGRLLPVTRSPSGRQWPRTTRRV